MTPTAAPASDLLANLASYHLGRLLRCYRRHAAWLNAVRAHIDSMPRKTVDGKTFADFDRAAEATVPSPSVRRMPAKKAKWVGYEACAWLAAYKGFVCSAANKGTMREWRECLTHFGVGRLPKHPEGC